MNKERAIEVLNTLIIINNDRIEGYETASKGTEELDLKILFAQFISTSRKLKEELVNEVNLLEGKVLEGTMVSGKFFRVWMDVKAALTNRDRKSVLNSCEYGEETATDAYDKVLENESEHLTAEQYFMISDQKTVLIADQDQVRLLRDALVDA